MKNLMEKLHHGTANKLKESSNNWVRENVLSSARFEGFVADNRCHVDVQKGLSQRTAHSLDCGVLLPLLSQKRNMEEKDPYTNIKFLKFLPGGKRLLCVEVKDGVVVPRNKEESLHESQIVIMRCGISCEQRSVGTTSYEFENVSQNIYQESALPLKFSAIFCVDMSSNGTYLAICGINEGRPNVIIVYRITLKCNCTDMIESSGLAEGERIEITKEALYQVEGLGRKAFDITMCKFSPDSSILVTVVGNLNAYNSPYIDFWNFRSRSHVGKLVPGKNYAGSLTGHLCSLAFSPDSDIIVMCTEASQVILYSISRSAFGSSIYNLKCPARFMDFDWKPAYCCWTPSLETSDFVVCLRDGTIASYRLNSRDLSLSIIGRSQIFSNRQLAGLSVRGAEFCSATLKLLIRVSYNETFIYDVVSDTICQRLVCSNLSYRERRWMMCITIATATAISRHGREVAMSTGETINIFLLPEHDISLLSLCRDVIIRHIPEDKIIDLPIPKHLQVYLLFSRCSIG